MHYAIFTRFNLAGVDRHGATRINEDDPRCGVRLVRELVLLFVARSAAQVRDPVIEKVIGLRLERVCTDRNDCVGKFGIFVAIVQLSDTHIACRVNLGIVCWTIVDANILDLHRAEIELSGAPGILVAAPGAAVVESGNE